MLRASNSTRPDVLSMRFNQDHSCFSVGTTSGFLIFSCDPFQESSHRYFGPRAGIGIVEMLFRCNIVALVGGGRNPHWPSSKVIIWDDDQEEELLEIGLNSEVQNVRLRRDKIVVVLAERVHVYDGMHSEHHGQPLYTFQTYPNPCGLSALSPHSTRSVLAIPALSAGSVMLQLFDPTDGSTAREHAVAAHDAALSALTLSFDGSRLATCSEKGTLIRIFCTQTGQSLQELRRGLTQASIYSLAFNVDAQCICSASTAGTLHVWSLAAPAPDPLAEVDQRYRVIVPSKDNFAATIGRTPALQESTNHTDAPPNSKSLLSFMSGMLPSYFSSEWSFAQFRGASAPCICTFSAQPRTIIVVGEDLNFYQCAYPEDGGECELQETHFFGHRRSFDR